MFYKGKHRQRFSIRKYSFGAASVLLGAVIVGVAAPSVNAEETQSNTLPSVQVEPQNTDSVTAAVENEEASSGILANTDDRLSEVQTPVEEEVVSEDVESESSEVPVPSEEAPKETPQKEEETVDASSKALAEPVVVERPKTQAINQELTLAERKDEQDLAVSSPLRSVVLRAADSGNNEPTETVTAAVDQVIKRGVGSSDKVIAFTTEYVANDQLEAGTQKVVQEGVNGGEKTVFQSQTGSGSLEITPKSQESTEVVSKSQVIIVLVEDSPGMYLDDVSKLSPLWNNLQAGDKLLWIRARSIPETFEKATASFSVKGVDESINRLKSIADISAKDIPERYGLSAEEIAGADLRLETDLYTTDDNALNKNTSLKALLNSVGSLTISVRSRERSSWFNSKYRHAEAAIRKAGFTYKIDDKDGLLSVEPKTERQTVVTYKPLKIALGDDSGELKITSARLITAGQEINLPITNGKVSADYQPASNEKLVIDYAFEGVATAQRTILATVSADGQEVKRNSTQYDVKVSVETTDPVTKRVEVGTKPKVETHALPYETIYQEDSSMKATDLEVVLVEGQNGEIVVTTTYTLDTKTGTVSENEPTEKVTAPVNRVVKRGVGQETTIPYKTVYQADETLEAGEKQTKTQGVTGVMQPDGSISKQAVDELILVGTKPKVVEETIAYETFYEANDEQPLGDERIKNAGVKGLIVTTTTYTLDTTTGNVTASEPVSETVRKVINRIVRLGTKPTEKETAIAYETEYVTDDKMGIDDPEVVVQEGQAGKRVVTTTYKVDKTTGAVTPDKEAETSTPAVNKIVKRGIGKETTIPYNIFYETDETLNVGERVVTKKGELGLRHPNGVITKTAVSEYVKVGTKPTVSTEVIVYKTVYQDDPTMKTTDPVVLVTKGQDGLKTSTVTYTLDTMTGNVIAQAPQVTIAPAVDEVIKRGVGEDTVLPYDTLYVANTAVDRDVRVVKQAGQHGLRHPNGTVTKEPVTLIIEVGTKPTVVEETLDFITVYQNDASMKASEPEVLVKEGVLGKKISTTNYTLNEKTGEVSMSPVQVELIPAVNRIMNRGIGEDTVLPYEISYIADETMAVGRRQLVTKGENGVRHPNGTVTKEAVTEVVRIGTEPITNLEKLPYKTIYQDDATMKADDPEVIVVAGKIGLKTTVTTFTLDTKTGDVTANEPQVLTVDAVDEVIKRGVGEDTLLPYKTVFVANAELDYGIRNVVVEGIEGIRHPNGSITREVVNEVIEVGVKPQITEEILAHKTIYQDDPTMSVNDPDVIAVEGVDGKRIIKVTYLLNEETGEVTAQVSEQLIAPIDEVIKRGICEPAPLPEPCPAPIPEPCPTPMVEVVEEQEAPVVAEMLPETGDDNSAAAVGVGAILLGMIGLSGISGRKKSED